MTMDGPLGVAAVDRGGPVALGAAVYDPRSRSLFVGGRRHGLEPRVAGVLALLIARSGAPVTRDEFLDQVWGEAGSDEALTQAVSRLRRLLGDAQAVKTLPRVGYQLGVTPQQAAIPTQSGAIMTLQSLMSRAGGRRLGSHAMAFAAGFALAAIVGLLWLVAHGPISIEEEIFITGPGQSTELVRLSED